MAQTKVKTKGITDTNVTNAKLGTDISAAKLTAGTVATARLGSGTGSSSTILYGDQTYKTEPATYNDDALQNDIATLALHQATNANAAKYNLANTNVDVYQDSTGVASFTDCARDTTGEYIATIYDDTAYGTQAMVAPNSNITVNTGGWTGSITDDQVVATNGSSPYDSGTVDYLFDLSKDFKIKLFGVTSSTGNNDQTTDYLSYSGLITTDTSESAGANPSILRDGDNTFNNYGYVSESEWGDYIITAAYAATIGSDSYTWTKQNSSPSGGTLSVNCSSTNALFTLYNNDVSTGAQKYGMSVLNDASANTMTVQCWTDAAQTTESSGATQGRANVTNVPSTGRFVLSVGYGQNSSNGLQTGAGWGTTYNTADNTNFGYVITPTANATGNYVSTATTANASVSKVGIVITYKNQAGTNTLNTDIVAQVSADGGSNYSTVTLAAAGTFSTGVLQAVANDVSVTAGTSIQYKISFANQASGSKEARITGVSLIY